MLTDSEKKRRQYRVNFAINNNAIEGLFVSEELKELLKLWINDEITLEEVEKKFMRYGGSDFYTDENGVLKNKFDIKVAKNWKNLERYYRHSPHSIK